jgi:DME family drug/metabolite transporter
MPEGRPLAAVTAVVLSTALFGTVGTARVLGPDVPAASVAAVRLALGALALVAVALVARVTLGQLRGLWRHRATWVAGAGMAAFQVSFLAAVAVTGVAVGTLVAIGSAPLFTGLLTRQGTRVWAVATSLSIVGLALLVLGGGAEGRLSLAGALLALGAGLSYACYTAASKRLTGAGPLAPPAAAFAVAAVLAAPALVLTDLSWMARPDGLIMALYLALVPTAVSYVLFARGLMRLPASTVSTLGLTEPVVAAGLGVVLLGERLAPAGLLGALLVLLGLAVLARATTRRPVPAAV